MIAGAMAGFLGFSGVLFAATTRSKNTQLHIDYRQSKSTGGRAR